MKILKKIMFFAIVVFTLTFSSSCSNNDSSDDNQTTGEYIKFKYNGTFYTFDPSILSSENINIMGDEGINDTYKKISLWIPLNVTTGSHPIVFDLSHLETTYQVSFGFMPAFSNADASSGTMNVTAVNNEKIEGTFNFSGTVNGQAFTVTEGTFRVLR